MLNRNSIPYEMSDFLLHYLSGQPTHEFFYPNEEYLKQINSPETINEAMMGMMPGSQVGGLAKGLGNEFKAGMGHLMNPDYLGQYIRRNITPEFEISPNVKEYMKLRRIMDFDLKRKQNIFQKHFIESNFPMTEEQELHDPFFKTFAKVRMDTAKRDLDFSKDIYEGIKKLGPSGSKESINSMIKNILGIEK